MTSIIMGELKKKVYYLGYKHYFNKYNGITVSFSYQVYDKSTLSIDSPTNDEGEIKSCEEFDEYIPIKRTEDFHRELKVGEIIIVDKKEYAIQKVAHGDNGYIYYYINNYLTIEDKDSFEQAKKDLDLRTVFLKGRQTELENKKLIKDNEDKIGVAATNEFYDTLPKIEIKKWYQFWK